MGSFTMWKLGAIALALAAPAAVLVLRERGAAKGSAGQKCGFRGWLGLLAFWVALAPVEPIARLWALHIAMDGWAGSGEWQLMMGGVIVLTLLPLGLQLIVAVLMHLRHARFPRLYVWMAACTACYPVAAAAWAAPFAARMLRAPFWQVLAYGALAEAHIGAIVMTAGMVGSIFYVRRSRRVANTFVDRR